VKGGETLKKIFLDKWQSTCICPYKSSGGRKFGGGKRGKKEDQSGVCASHLNCNCAGATTFYEEGSGKKD